MIAYIHASSQSGERSRKETIAMTPMTLLQLAGAELPPPEVGSSALILNSHAG